MMKSIVVKNVESGESAVLRHLAVKCPPLDVHTPYTYWVISEFFGDCSYIARDGETPIGFITCIKNNAKMLIWQIGILEEYRSKGISYILIDKALTNATMQGLADVYVTIAEDNKSSYYAFKNYCAKNGYSFEKVGLAEIADLDEKDFSETEVIYRITKL